MSDLAQGPAAGWLEAIPRPPRHVRARAALRAGWVLALIGGVLLAPSAILALTFGLLGVDLLPLKDDALDAEGARTQATIVAVTASTLRVGDSHFDRVTFRFTPHDGAAVDGKSFAPAGRFAPGDPCEVDYLLHAPEIARISGTRRNPLGLVWTVLVGFVLLPALVLCLFWYRGTRRAKVLLSTGRRALARVVEQRPVTGVKPPQLRVHYEFDDALGRSAADWQWVALRSALGRHLEAGGVTVPVIYDEGDPTKSRLVQPGDFIVPDDDRGRR